MDILAMKIREIAMFFHIRGGGGSARALGRVVPRTRYRAVSIHPRGVSLYNSIRAPAKMSLCPVRGGHFSACVFIRDVPRYFRKIQDTRFPRERPARAASGRARPFRFRPAIFRHTDEEYAPRENLRARPPSLPPPPAPPPPPTLRIFLIA